MLASRALNESSRQALQARRQTGGAGGASAGVTRTSGHATRLSAKRGDCLRFDPAARPSQRDRRPTSMEASRTITRRSASNLALAFVLLPRAKREGMSALYAFCREVDDIADNETLSVEDRRQRLAGWREDIVRACAGQAPELPVIREFAAVHSQAPIATCTIRRVDSRRGNGFGNQTLRDNGGVGAILLSCSVGGRTVVH